MSQSAMPLETTHGFAPPSVTQFSVFLENRVGKLHDLVCAFERSPIHLVALSVHDAADFAVVRILTDNMTKTEDLLREKKFAYTKTDLLVVDLGKTGSMERMCLYLLGAELNIRFAYPLMLRPNGTPVIALAVDDVTLAGQILRRKEFRLLGEADLPRATPE